MNRTLRTDESDGHADLPNGIGDGARLRSLSLSPPASCYRAGRRADERGDQLEGALGDRVTGRIRVDEHQVLARPEDREEVGGRHREGDDGRIRQRLRVHRRLDRLRDPRRRFVAPRRRRWRARSRTVAPSRRTGRPPRSGRSERRQPPRRWPDRAPFRTRSSGPPRRLSPRATDRPRCHRRCRPGSGRRGRSRRPAARPRASRHTAGQAARGGGSRHRPVDGPSNATRKGWRSRCRIGQIALEAAMVLICTRTLPGRQPLG